MEVLGPARRAVMAAYGALIEMVDTFDPADPAGYAQINVQLGQLEAANNLLFTAMNTLYTQLDALIAGQAWDAVFTTYVTLLDCARCRYGTDGGRRGAAAGGDDQRAAVQPALGV